MRSALVVVAYCTCAVAGLYAGAALGTELRGWPFIVATLTIGVLPAVFVRWAVSRNSVAAVASAAAVGMVCVTMAVPLQATRALAHLRASGEVIPSVLWMCGGILLVLLQCGLVAAVASRHRRSEGGVLRSLQWGVTAGAVCYALAGAIALVAMANGDLRVIVAGVTALALSTVIGSAWVRIWVYSKLSAEAPNELRDAITDVERAAGAEFAQVMYLPSLAHGFVAEVHTTPRGSSVLVVSEACVRLFEPGELRAVVAHELAHAALRHGVKRACVHVAAVALAVMAVAVVMRGAPRLSPGGPALALTGAVVLTAGVARYLGESALARRCEREADEFAAAIVGADVVASALEKPQFAVAELGRPYQVLLTHEPPSRRVSRLNDSAGSE